MILRNQTEVYRMVQVILTPSLLTFQVAVLALQCTMIYLNPMDLQFFPPSSFHLPDPYCILQLQKILDGGY